MDWLQVFTIAASTIGACWWFNRGHKEDMKEFKDEFKAFREDWKKESKDFHGRLCSLEEKYIQMMQRFMEQRKK
jgi:hypothetical protein